MKLSHADVEYGPGHPTSVHCGNCEREIGDGEYATEINPEGGFGRPRFLVCDACLPIAGEANAQAPRL